MNKSLTIFHHALATATITATAPLANRKHFNQNELNGNSFTDTGTGIGIGTNTGIDDTDETFATVIPVSTIVSTPTNLLNERKTDTDLLATSHQITTVTSTIQQQQPSSLQQIKNETKTVVALRNQLDLRASTKS